MPRVAEGEEQSYRFTVGEASILEAVVDAAAFVLDVDPLDLEPLAETIDPDALERVVASSDSVRVSFVLGTVDVTVRGSGEIEVTTPAPDESIHADLDGASNVLLVGDVAGERCHEHLSGFESGRTALISLQTARSADEVVREWASSPPAAVSVLEVGEMARTAAASAAAGTPTISVEPVDDLASIGARVSEQLTETAAAPTRPAVCVDSLDDLVAAHGIKRVFMFLQPILSRVRKAGGLAHAHLDPTAIDDLDRYTLGTLFDAVVEADADGELTVRKR